MLFPYGFDRVVRDADLLSVCFVHKALIGVLGLQTTLVLCYLVVEYFFVFQINFLLLFPLLSFPFVGLLHLFDKFSAILVLNGLLGAFVFLDLLDICKFGFLGGVVAISLSYQQNRHQQNQQQPLVIIVVPGPQTIIKHSVQSYNQMEKQQEKDIVRVRDGKKRPQSRKEDEQEGIGPSLRKMQKIEYHELLLDGLPSSDLYEISFMHKETINNVVASPKADYIITVSIDGHIKFWKKVFQLVEFAKNFKAHSGLITGVALSKNHDLFCSVGLDKTLKIFDVLNCDLRLSIRLNFVPSACEFIPQEGRDWQLIAISEQKTGKIWIVDPQFSHNKQKLDEDEEVVGALGAIVPQNEQGQNKKQESSHIVNQVSFHKHPIKFIKMNWALNFCVSIDERGFLQIWDPKTFDFPKHMPYKCKIQTDFLQLLQANSVPLSLSLSPLGTYLAVILKDKIIRIFNLKTGKMVHTIPQNIKEVIKIQEDTNHPLHITFALQQAEYEKKLNLEKDLEITKQFLFNPNVEFDESEEFIVYTSFHGIKLYSLSNKCVQRTIGRKENERFIRVSLFQGKQMRNPNGNANIQGERKATDPIIIATSFRRPRFYIFSRRVPQIEPENAMVRDIINERQTREESATVVQPKITEKQNEVIFQTTMGDIHLLLYLEDCPKTCENFIKLVKKGYYNGMIFHRVIKGFMIQSGCPKGDGTGGQSVWGGMFQDELRPQKYRFDRPYVLAMANRGPNTNGSQFFITVIACPWLDNKHTIFGRVIKGIEAVCDINKQKTDKGEKPLVNIKIMSAKVV